MTQLRSTLIVCLGANLPSSEGFPAETLRAAITQMPKNVVFPTSISRFYATPCFPAGTGPDYVNAALTARTSLSPPQVLTALHRIETAFGRNRLTRWGQRTLDLDLIAYDNCVCPDAKSLKAWMNISPDLQKLTAPDQLILPHPRMQDRGFVLVPINDVAPDWRHPVLGQTVADMLAALDPAEISPITAL